MDSRDVIERFEEVTDEIQTALDEYNEENETNIKQIDFLNADFNDKYDVVISLGFIEHFDDVEDIFKTLEDISRILKVGGYLFFSTPCANPFSFEHIKCSLKKNGIQPSKDGFRRFYFEDAGHIRRLKSGEISAILKDCRIEEVPFFYDCHFFGGLQWMYGDKLRPIVKNLKNITGIKRLVAICLIPFLPIVYTLDFLGWFEWVLFKKLPNGSGMFGVFKKIAQPLKI
jgi:SAM-dependent methyltransferase